MLGLITIAEHCAYVGTPTPALLNEIHSVKLNGDAKMKGNL